MIYGTPTTVTNGLVLYLDAANSISYVSGSTIWNDISGLGSRGTLINGPTFNTGSGGGIAFDGVDDHIIIPSNTSFNTTQPTVELVATVSTNGGNVLARGQYGVNWNFGVGIRSTSILARNNNGDAIFSVNSSGIVHITVTWDGSGNQFYKNGEYLGRTTTAYSPVQGGDITIGGVRSQAPSQNLQEFANSIVYSLKIYNRALTAREILQNYNATKSRFNLS